MGIFYLYWVKKLTRKAFTFLTTLLALDQELYLEHLLGEEASVNEFADQDVTQDGHKNTYITFGRKYIPIAKKI